MKPLFIPLKREFFEAFESGGKDTEYRIYGPRWNEKTCVVGRPVVLSLGYGPKRRLTGTVSSFRVENTATAIPGWTRCYGNRANVPAACIGITLSKAPAQ